MIVQFFSRGKGKGAGPIDYLLGRDRKREAARLLRGNPTATEALIDGSPHAKKYTSGCLSFEESDITAEQKQALMDDFEKCLFVGLEANQYDCLWVEHRDKGRLELNFVIPNVELTTGKRLQPYYHAADTKRVDAWRTIQNITYGFSDPDDPAKRQAFTKAKDLPKAAAEAIEAISNGLMGYALDGQINSREDVVSALESAGFEIARLTPNSISIKNPEGGRNIRLKGQMYEQDFRFSEEFRAEITRRTAEQKSVSAERLGEARARYNNLLRRKREEHFKRHRADLREPKINNQALARTESRINTSTESNAKANARASSSLDDENTANGTRASASIEDAKRRVQQALGGIGISNVTETGSSLGGSRNSSKKSSKEVVSTLLARSDITGCSGGIASVGSDVHGIKNQQQSRANSIDESENRESKKPRWGNSVEYLQSEEWQGLGLRGYRQQYAGNLGRKRRISGNFAEGLENDGNRIDVIERIGAIERGNQGVFTERSTTTSQGLRGVEQFFEHVHVCIGFRKQQHQRASEYEQILGGSKFLFERPVENSRKAFEDARNRFSQANGTASGAVSSAADTTRQASRAVSTAADTTQQSIIALESIITQREHEKEKEREAYMANQGKINALVNILEEKYEPEITIEYMAMTNAQRLEMLYEVHKNAQKAPSEPDVESAPESISEEKQKENSRDYDFGM